MSEVRVRWRGEQLSMSEVALEKCYLYNSELIGVARGSGKRVLGRENTK